MEVGKTSLLDCKISKFCQNSRGTKNMKLNLSSTEQKSSRMCDSDTQARMEQTRKAHVEFMQPLSITVTLHFCPFPIMNDGILSYIGNCRFMSK